MSAYREQVETTISSTTKGVKILGWIFIAIGVALTATQIGAIIGIPMIIAGLFFAFLLPKIFAKGRAAALEEAEIREHMLRQARASKPLDEPRQDEANHK